MALLRQPKLVVQQTRQELKFEQHVVLEVLLERVAAGKQAAGW